MMSLMLRKGMLSRSVNFKSAITPLPLFRGLSTFGVFDSREKTEENRYIRDVEKHNLDSLHSSEKATKESTDSMHCLDVGRSEILHILLESGEPLSSTTIDKICWSLFTEFKKILK